VTGEGATSRKQPRLQGLLLNPEACPFLLGSSLIQLRSRLGGEIWRWWKRLREGKEGFYGHTAS
jgi:hypothetical protein